MPFKPSLMLRPLDARITPATFYATNLNDSGLGSLRQAFVDASKSAGTDTIDATALNGTLHLTSGELAGGSIDLIGPGSSKLTIDAGRTNFRVMRFLSDNDVSITGMTITGGKVAGNGGGILASGARLTMTDVVVTGNEATGNSDGGGIGFTTLNPSLTLKNCTISNNIAGYDGGGISFSNSYTSGSDKLMAVDSSIFGNRAGNQGGAIWFLGGNSALSFFVVQNCTISGNASGGETYPSAIYMAGMNKGSNILFQNSTVTANKSGPNSAIVNSTLFGGGVDTVVRLESSVVADNSGLDLIAPTVSSQKSLVGSKTGVTTFTDLGGTLFGTANLLPLTANGGSTWSHRPKFGSPVVDKGMNAALLVNDQRGVGFPRQIGSGVDIGAVEIDATVPQAEAKLAPLSAVGQSVHQFEVTFIDDNSIDVTSLGSDDVRVIGPGGFDAVAAFVKVDDANNGSPRTATYEIVAPGGVWGTSHNGVYSVTIESNQVADTTGNFVPVHTVGLFRIGVQTTYLVDTIVDEDDGNVSAGDLSLREAIRLANTGVSAVDVIQFDSSIFSTSQVITLTAGELLITDPLSIVGPGASLLTISGNNTSRIFNVYVGTNALGVVTLSDLTLTAAATTGRGGAINSPEQDLVLTNIIVTGSKAGSGGAVAQQSFRSSILIDGCTFVGNVSNSGFSGEGGGALFLQAADSITIRNSVFSSNSATNDGGAFRNFSSSTVLVEKCIFENNTTGTTGGAFYGIVSSVVILRDTTFSNNKSTSSSGGLRASAIANLLIEGCTFSSNQSANSNGGGITIAGAYDATLLIRNSTFSGNTSKNPGGAINLINDRALTITNCTIVGNSSGSSLGGGIARSTGKANIVLESTIVSGNTGSTAPDLSTTGSLSALNSAIGNKTGVTTFVNLGGNLFGANLKLGSLAQNGGSTQTIALLPGSPCIDAGINNGGLVSDQRGAGFNRVVGKAADMGAFEVQPPPKVLNVQVNDGSTQRSRVTSLTVTFNQLVTFSGVPATAFGLKRQTDSVSVSLNATAGTTFVMLTFTDGPLDFGSLADGLYTLTIDSNQVSNGNGLLDGDNDDIAGGTFLFNGSTANGLFRLFGDSDGNGTVNAVDFAAFRGFFGLSGPSIFDFNNDGLTNATDFAQFRGRFGITLAP